MFEVPGSDTKTVHITEESVRGGSSPVYIKRSSSSVNSPSSDPNSTGPSSSTTSEEEETTKVRVTQ